MKNCIYCGYAVSQGDRHSKSACPPKAGHTGSHYAHKLKRKRERSMTESIERGSSIAFIRTEGKITGVKHASPPKAGKR